jgi:hypothetical protein
MRISGPHGTPLPVAPTAPPRARENAAPQPAEVAGPAAADAPAEAKPHGLVRAAGHSHRSDVAALRQWINHPDLRAELPVPDLTAEHKGNGFQKAVAAYQAAVAIGTPTPPADPAPVVTDPAPVVTDPAPVVIDPAPVESGAAPVETDAAPVVPDEPTA